MQCSGSFFRLFSFSSRSYDQLLGKCIGPLDACTSFHPPREHRSIGAIILFFCIGVQLRLRVARTSCTPLEQGARSIQSEALTGRRGPMRGSERQESREQSDNLVKCSFNPVHLWRTRPQGAGRWAPQCSFGAAPRTSFGAQF